MWSVRGKADKVEDVMISRLFANTTCEAQHAHAIERKQEKSESEQKTKDKEADMGQTPANHASPSNATERNTRTHNDASGAHDVFPHVWMTPADLPLVGQLIRKLPQVRHAVVHVGYADAQVADACHDHEALAVRIPHQELSPELHDDGRDRRDLLAVVRLAVIVELGRLRQLLHEPRSKLDALVCNRDRIDTRPQRLR